MVDRDNRRGLQHPDKEGPLTEIYIGQDFLLFDGLQLPKEQITGLTSVVPLRIVKTGSLPEMFLDVKIQPVGPRSEAPYCYNPADKNSPHKDIDLSEYPYVLKVVGFSPDESLYNAPGRPDVRLWLSFPGFPPVEFVSREIRYFEEAFNPDSPKNRINFDFVYRLN